MKNHFIIASILTAALMAPACVSKNPADPAAPRATVFLRDGTSFTGAVQSTSPTQITLSGENNNSHTFDMKNVRSIEYAETASTAPAEPLAPPAGSAAAPPPAAPPGAARPAPVASAPPAPVRNHPDESIVKTRTNLLPAGTQVVVRTDETIDSRKAAEGQTFAAEIAKDVRDAHGDMVIPRGSNAQLVIRSASRGKRFTGASDLVLDLQSISIGGRQYQVDTTDIAQKGREGLGKNKRTGEFVGGGAALGAIIGAIAGQGKGAAIGAASGAAAGAATQLVTRGGSVRVPAESLLTFRLDQPLRVYPTR
ncbi:MAG TPA: YMGG-like glycine zipper-containing protein [Bryobacteraceae bacterium]|nr:YMGG-like glycine zipper-containing protein [Bryobacteraceae bacterium]